MSEVNRQGLLEADNEINTIDTTIKILRATTKTADRLHPALKLSFGYIGNLERWGDDRGWSIFATLPDWSAANACNVRWGNVNTDQLPTLAMAAAMGEAFDWADRQALLAAGKLFIVRG